MTDDEYEEAYDCYDDIVDSITLLVEDRLTGLTEQQKDFIVNKLSEDYRFWN